MTIVIAAVTVSSRFVGNRSDRVIASGAMKAANDFVHVLFKRDRNPFRPSTGFPKRDSYPVTLTLRLRNLAASESSGDWHC